MVVFKEIKKNSKKSLKKNYLITVIVGLIGLFFLTLYGSTMNSLLNGFECIQNYYDNGHFMTNNQLDYFESGLYNKELDYNELYVLSDQELAEKGFNEAAIRYIHSLDPDYKDKTDLVQRLKVRDGFTKPILNLASNEARVIFENVQNIALSILSGDYIEKASDTALFSIFAVVAFRLFFFNVLKVGYARFFLENSKYHKTKVGRVCLPFSKNYFKVCRVMALKSLYQFLWNFTIIGGIIKGYSYRLVPYIVAEDNDISPKEAINLSRNLMRGYKRKALLFDLSFILWRFLSNFLFGLIGILFVNPYMEGAYAEFYKAVIKTRRDEDFYLAYLNGKEYADKDLYIEEDKDYYPGAKPTVNYIVMQDYTPLNIITLFFVFSFVGWCCEISLFLLKTHMFVNRGTLIGPWLPIYGIGCVLILLLFTKTKLKKQLPDPVVLFLCIMILCGSLEYFSSWFLETTTGLKYWDYSGHFLSINGRICFENLCEFGLGGLICIYLIGPKLNEMIEKLNKKTLNIIVTILMILFVLDNVYVRIHPRTGYGITDSIIDESGNVIDKDGNIVE